MNKEGIIFRNERGQFAKREQTPSMESLSASEQARSNELAHRAMWDIPDAIEVVRHELGTIQAAIPPTAPLIELRLPELEGGAEMGILGDKILKRTQKEVKEKSPKQFSEMLVTVNDIQLLKDADQEALGAFLMYIDANKNRITHFVANGDIANFTAQSGFDKDLASLNATNDEIEATRWFIDYVSRQLPNAKKVFIWGNHEVRWENLVEAEKGNEAWIKTIDEQFGLSENGWEQIRYGEGQYYRWHDRIFWHGHRSGSVANIPKLELSDAGVSVTTGHVNRNMFHESVDALGNKKSGITHGGLSKDKLGFMKKANTGWSQGFGVYYWDKKVGEQAYLVTISHRSPRFISPDGEVFDGKGFRIPGFETRGRPRG